MRLCSRVLIVMIVEHGTLYLKKPDTKIWHSNRPFLKPYQTLDGLQNNSRLIVEHRVAGLTQLLPHLSCEAYKHLQELSRFGFFGIEGLGFRV